MAEVETSSSSEDVKQGPLAAPKFVFGEKMSERVQGTEKEVEGDKVENKSEKDDGVEVEEDGQGGSFAEKVAEKLKRRAEESEGSESDEQEPENETAVTSPIKKTRKLSFELKEEEEIEDKSKFKFRPSSLTEVANNLVAHSQASFVKSSSPTEKSNPKTFGVPSSDTNSTTTSSSRPHFVASPIACGNYFQQFLSGGTSLISPKTDSGFVFGQNLKERVVKSDSPGENDTDHRNSNTESEQEDGEEEKKELQTLEDLANLSENERDHITVAKNSLSLAEAAQAYQDSTACPILAPVPVVTGEEDERNVLQMQCKLFVFSPSLHSWIEHGRGILRLNDFSQTGGEGILQSRLVVRTNGSLKVILNTKLWADMTIERASEKSVRLMAMDTDQSIKIFLITSSPKDVHQLYTAIERRVQAMKSVGEPEELLKQENSPVFTENETSTEEPVIKSVEASASDNRTQHRSTSGNDSDDEE